MNEFPHRVEEVARARNAAMAASSPLSDSMGNPTPNNLSRSTRVASPRWAASTKMSAPGSVKRLLNNARQGGGIGHPMTTVVDDRAMSYGSSRWPASPVACKIRRPSSQVR